MIEELPATGALALDDVEPLHAEVGYGELGRHGWLGYEGGRVVVGGRVYESALSTHPPAHLRYRLPDGAASVRCLVALNDDVAGNGSHAAFSVVADGRVVAEVPFVRAGDAPVSIAADLGSASILELTVSSMS